MFVPLRMAATIRPGFKQRRVLPGVVARAALVHGLGARDQAADVDASDRGGDQAHRAQLGEAPAHAVGDVESLVALLRGRS